MNVFTRFATGALIATAFGTVATAAEWTGPRVIGTGDDASVVYSAPNANVVGGALSRVVGTGDNASVEAITVQSEQPGRIGRVVGSGENLSVIYDAAPAPRRFGQRG